MVQEDVVVVDLADDDDVIEVPATCTGEGCPELDEHSASIVLRCHDEYGVCREDSIEVVRSERGGHLRTRSVVRDET